MTLYNYQHCLPQSYRCFDCFQEIYSSFSTGVSWPYSDGCIRPVWIPLLSKFITSIKYLTSSDYRVKIWKHKYRIFGASVIYIVRCALMCRSKLVQISYSKVSLYELRVEVGLRETARNYVLQLTVIKIHLHKNHRICFVFNSRRKFADLTDAMNELWLNARTRCSITYLCITWFSRRKCRLKF